MRTSHKKIHQMIADEKSKLTDKDLFASKAYQAYLMDLVEVTTGRYKRKIKVRTRWDETPGADIAYTDNRIIDLNCGNYLTASYPTRELKHVSLIGFLGHEAAHILYTDFSTLAVFMQAVDNGTMYPSVPLDLEPDEQEYLEKYLEVLKEKDQKVICIIKYILHSISNILEDCYVEGSMCTDFPGKFKTGIVLNNVKLTEDALSVTQQIEKEIPPAAILMNMILQYARIGEYNNDGGYKGDLIDSFDSCIELVDEAIDKTDARRRYDCANRILIRMWPYVEEWIEEIKKDPSKTPQEVMDMLAFEKEAMDKLNLIPEIAPRYRVTYFNHIIGGYAAGYYSYLWANVLDNDAFEAFKEHGIFDKNTADLFRHNVLEKGDSEDPMVLYKNFRGAEPSLEPLLKNRGMK